MLSGSITSPSSSVISRARHFSGDSDSSSFPPGNSHSSGSLRRRTTLPSRMTTPFTDTGKRYASLSRGALVGTWGEARHGRDHIVTKDCVSQRPRVLLFPRKNRRVQRLSEATLPTELAFAHEDSARSPCRVLPART